MTRTDSHDPRACSAGLLRAAAVLFIISAASCARADQVRTALLAEFPFGSDSASFGTQSCEDCDDGICALGVAFLGPGNVLYLYDYGHNNLKVVTGLGSGTPSLAVLPGLASSHPQERPVDGTLTPNGDVVLLTDRGRREERYQLHRLARGRFQWDASANFDDDSVGWHTLGSGRRVVMVGDARLAVTPRGDLLLYSSHAKASGRHDARLVEISGRLVPQSERRSVERRVAGSSAANVTVLDGAYVLQGGGRPARRLSVRGDYVGGDRAGNHYFVAHGEGDEFRLERFDRNGTRVASAPAPRREMRRQLVAGSGRFALADGGILVISVTERAVELWRWDLEAHP